MTDRKKLIEVALPLDAINAAAAREKSIRHGHPSTLHLWWARRPLAACRAVLFAQLVDDPSGLPGEFPSEEAQEAERQRLFGIITALVQWENSTRRSVLEAARREIARSVARNAAVPLPETPAEVASVLKEHAPPVLDPFCGGGSIPLEAQRLGLEAHGSDLNPVAVLITKALIEIPPKFAGQPPVNPEAHASAYSDSGWTGAKGLAADVRYYGAWMRDEAHKRIGHLYPKVPLPLPGANSGTAGVSPAPSPETGDASPSPRPRGEATATVIAWLWARTVTCPNPACGATMPLVRSFWLSTKPGKKAWVEPVVDHTAKTVSFEVKTGQGTPPEPPKVGRGAKFKCLVCEQIAPEQHIKNEGKAKRMGAQLMAIVAEGVQGRVYLPPLAEHIAVAKDAEPEWTPEQPLANDLRNLWCIPYGLETFTDLFTPRQLVTLTTFSDLVAEARERARRDATAAGLPDDGVPLAEGGADATGYGDSVATYLAFTISRFADSGCTLAAWQSVGDKVAHAFSRQALPMVWDYAEVNPFSGSTRNFLDAVGWVAESLEVTPASRQGHAMQRDAVTLASNDPRCIISTDPPYYDNIGYADLSDFFYVWLRRSLIALYPGLFRTMLVPKAQELVATPYRFDGSKERARAFFEHGLGNAFNHLRQIAASDYPLTVYYAFKQAESGRDSGDDHESDPSSNGTASTGWESMLAGLIKAGFSVTGTWPMRSERGGRMNDIGANALASSIVLVCRPRPADAPMAARRDFIAALRRELPDALKKLQHGNVAPVDLAQAAIGPGMAVFSRYSRVLEADGKPMSVRTALQLINGELDAYLSTQEGETDPETRFCLAWFEQYGMRAAKFGEADVLARAKNTSVNGLRRAGVLDASGGEVRLRPRDAMDHDPAAHGHPAGDERRSTDWECAQRLILALHGSDGEAGAARVAAGLGAERAQVARDLAYRLYAICERKGWADEALAYNALVASWQAIQRKAAEVGTDEARQGTLAYE